ncbi:hypothetical protein CO666_09250 [Rhizobium chutanense]|uniref:Uncharacterized protein n=1 Tax=Rhizobium chutanense TaxID=2035448 RepID=A0A2A6JFV8_9HYPH|nr:hypothetical protein [Rhizobium chutanense]PDT04900.1 hypothetical protein CO666_09250 [Rhizobium chutanense]
MAIERRFQELRHWVILIMLIFVALFASQVSAKSADPTAFEKKLIRLLDAGDCAQAWKELWSLARQRDQKTLRDIVFAIIPYRALVPPSYFPLTENSLQSHMVNHMIALKLYNWKDPEISAKFDKYGLSLDSNPPEVFANAQVQNEYRKVDVCLRTHKDKSACVNAAIELKLIPDFDSYVAMMDHAPREAFCLPLPGPKRVHISPNP